MATQIPLDSPPWTSESERLTAPLGIADEPIVDSLGLLDHRTRSRAVSPRLAPPGHYLALSNGQEERLIAIDEQIIHLGRGAGADLRFDDARVSRSHAIIVRYGHHVRVLDDRSSNGTFVNGCRVVAIDVYDGDVIRLGRVVFRYQRLR
jgi:hypothetical protein